MDNRPKVCGLGRKRCSHCLELSPPWLSAPRRAGGGRRVKLHFFLTILVRDPLGSRDRNTPAKERRGSSLGCTLLPGAQDRRCQVAPWPFTLRHSLLWASVATGQAPQTLSPCDLPARRIPRCLSLASGGQDSRSMGGQPPAPREDLSGSTAAVPLL